MFPPTCCYCVNMVPFVEIWSGMSQRQSTQPRVGGRGPAKAATRKMVMAMLDGGTPLHFAAAAGGVEQVPFFLLVQCITQCEGIEGREGLLAFPLASD